MIFNSLLSKLLLLIISRSHLITYGALSLEVCWKEFNQILIKLSIDSLTLRLTAGTHPCLGLLENDQSVSVSEPRESHEGLYRGIIQPVQNRSSFAQNHWMK